MVFVIRVGYCASANYVITFSKLKGDGDDSRCYRDKVLLDL